MNRAGIDIILIDNLAIGYRTRRKTEPVYQGIHACASKGELVSLMGKNGVGKSTLLKTLVRLIPDLGGTVHLEGVSYKTIHRHLFAKMVGFVSTEAVSSGNLSVLDVIGLGRFPYTNWLGQMTAADRAAVYHALQSTGLEKLAHKKLWEISDGERQRVMIARTLAQDTHIILLDEPTAFLDMPNKFEMLHLLNRLAKEQDKCIVFSTQDLPLAMEEADRMWLMLDDRFLTGSPEDLMIDGSIHRLFHPSRIILEPLTGQVKLPKERKIPVRLVAEGEEYTWTLRALEKSGCYIGTEHTSLYKISVINKKGERHWEIEKNQQKSLFTCLYDVILHIRTAQHNFTN